MRHVLDNGLTVLLDEVHAAPVVALQAWVKVGSADETEREAGLAHLHEHMLFKGTSRRGPGEIARDVESIGGEINAWTSFDQTVYHLVLGSRFLDEGLGILTDAVLDSAFDKDELAREIEVVIEEIKRSNDSPSRRASRELFQLVFEKHPYRRPVIGFERSVRSFRRDDVLDFYKRNYTPDNVTLVVVGDLDPATTLAHIEALWSDAKGKRGARAERASEPSQLRARVRIARAPVQESHLSLAWPIPGIRSPDLAALDLVTTVLGHGDSARLRLEVKRERKLCNEAYAYAYTPRDPGMLVIGATLRHDQVRAAGLELMRQLDRIRVEGVPAQELAVAKRLVESEAIWHRETVQGRARKLGFYETVAGDHTFETAYHEAIRATTSEELREVCDRYLRDDHLSVVALVSDEATLEEKDFLEELLARPAQLAPGKKTDRAAVAPPPVAAKVKPHGHARGETGIYRAELSSGVRVLVKPEPAVPIVSVRGAFLGGQRYEQAQTSGLHLLLARSISKGTKRRNARRLAETFDELGMSIGAQAGRNSFSLRGDFLSRTFEESLRLFVEVLREPAFDEREVLRERELQLEQLRARDDNPSGVAFRLFAESLYTRHPYRLDQLGQEETLARIGSEQLRAAYPGYYGLDNLVLAIVGDVDPDLAFARCEELLGHVDAKSVAAPDVPREPSIEAPRRVVREMDKEQAHLILGFPGATIDDPARRPLEVLASVLAGQSGRLFLELRDKRSMAYSVTAFSLEGIDPGHFAVYMGTSPEKVDAALAGIREELDKVIQQKIPDGELDRARRYLVGAHAIGLQKNAARAAVYALDETYGLGAEASARYEREIEQVTAERVLEAARAHLDPMRSVLALVTPSQGPTA